MTDSDRRDTHGLEAHATRRIAVAIAALSVVLLFFGEAVWVGNLSGDEASHVIMAQNIADDFDYFARPSITPLGDLDEKRNVVAFPPGDPLLRAIGIRLLGNAFVGSAAISALAWAATLFFLYRLAEWLAPASGAAPWTTMLAACSPGLLWLFAWQEAEPTMAAFGLGGTWLLVTALDRPSWWRALLGGALIGLAFVIKLYLVAPFLAVVGVYFLGRLFRAGKIVGSDLAWLALAIVGFVVAGSSHLLVVALRTPEELAFWIERVYFAPFYTDDTTVATKVGGSLRNAEHNHPVWYYLAVLYREHYLIVPILFGALLFAKENWRTWLRPAPLAVAAGVAVIALWSVPATKEPLYILPSATLLYLFAGAALAGFLQSPPERSRIVLIAALTGVLALAVGVTFLLGVKPDDLDPAFVVVHTLVALLTLAVLLLPRVASERSRPTIACALLAIVLIVGAAVSATLRFDGRANRHLASLMEQTLADAAVRDIAFVADDLNELQARLQRTGLMWKDLTDEELAAPGGLLAPDGRLGTARAFVTTPELEADPRYAALLTVVRQRTIPSAESPNLLLLAAEAED